MKKEDRLINTLFVLAIITSLLLFAFILFIIIGIIVG